MVIDRPQFHIFHIIPRNVWLLIIVSEKNSLKIAEYPLPKPEQQAVTLPWRHIVLKTVLQLEKDE